MTILTLLSKNNPSFNNLTMDVTLEQNLTSEVEIVSNPLESGVNVFDHRLYRPRMLVATYAIGSKVLTPQITDFLAGGLSNFVSGNGLAAAAAGLSAAWLAGDSSTRAAAALLQILDMQANGTPFSIDTGLIQLNNMVVQKVEQSSTPENETGLEVRITFVEMVTLERLPGDVGQPAQAQLRAGSVESTSITATVRRGLVGVKTATTSVANEVSKLFSL